LTLAVVAPLANAPTSWPIAATDTQDETGLAGGAAGIGPDIQPSASATNKSYDTRSHRKAAT
jgi:hypothetical protein